jgi:[protein-PII] uridylyltransferase
MAHTSAPHIQKQRAIIDRIALTDAIDTLAADQGEKARAPVLVLLQKALADGRAEIARRLIEHPNAGNRASEEQAFLTDQIIRIIHDYVVQYRYPGGNRSSGERLALLAVGGYGRGEMAPQSDVDIAFLTPYKRTAWSEQVVEAILYLLWDLSFKVGQSSRSIDEMVKLSKEDLTIRTAMLEARFIWGDREVYEESRNRFRADVVAGSEADFVKQKMAERDARHKRMGDSRYVVEPNVKDGKGGLRDLHTLYWIGKYLHRVHSPAELVDAGLFTASEYAKFERAENFLWAVRCHMHDIAGRAEDRLTFDLQREVAERMRFAERPGKSSVERFMKYYFLNAKTVGDLTGLFLANLDEAMAQRGRRFLPSIMRRPRKLNGFRLDRGRLGLPDSGPEEGDAFLRADPVRLIEMFALADKHGVEIHPQAMRAARQNAKLITWEVRRDPRATALFLDVLTSPRDPEIVLRWMNEATVFGAFIPDFNRVVAQMQFDMYHHFTVDEHTIQAIGLLTRIERGELAEDHPLATAIMPSLHMRRVLYVATLLHDIAKGRGSDHSILGAELALRICPRLGMNDAETETVSWLVRHHLLASATAFKRDLSDYKTIKDFADVVQSIERLKLLLVLTIVDIRAVGPGVWNSWKRQLLSDLYEATLEVLRLGHKQRGREDRIAAKRDALAASLGLSEAKFTIFAKRLTDAYWIAEPDDIILANARHMLACDADTGADGMAHLGIAAEFYPDRGATLVTVYAADHPGLFYRIAGAIHVAGGNIIDARIHTTRDGMAIDNFLVQDPLGQPFMEDNQLNRLKNMVTEGLTNRAKLEAKLGTRTPALRRAEAFKVPTSVIIDNGASNRFTVIEVTAADRPALLYHLAQALFQSKAILHSAHITTYGERAIDTFYITNLFNEKIESKAKMTTLEKRLLEAAHGLLEDNSALA